MGRRIEMFLAAATIAVFCTFGPEFGERLLPAGVHGFVARVEAIVGRPLTPVSIAGVARRTARRCSADIYDC